MNACTCLYSPACDHDPPRGPSGRPDCPPGCGCEDCVRRVDEFERAQIAVVDGHAWRDSRLIREIALQLASVPARATRAAREHAVRVGDPSAEGPHAFGALHSAARHAARRLLRMIGEELPDEDDVGPESESSTRPTIPCPPPIVPDPPASGATVGRSHCPACGNPDCPRVDPDPTWRRCPAADRVRRAS